MMELSTMKKRLVIIVIAFSALCSAAAQPPVPKEVVFAGDTISLTRADLRERMDRELLSFTYMHSTSVLMIKRANRLFPEIEPILKEYAVPDDLKYLMVIESSLDPTARSSAGAAGLWQFMSSTARSYGLHVDSEVDERYNTRKATVAACKYLREAYAKYGDWMTVAASYNAGQNGISKKLADQHEDNALDLWLVEETSRYMFRVLAAKIFFNVPAAFGFQFTREDLYPYIPPKKIVTVNGSISNLVDFAESYGVSYAELKRANLWLRDSKLVNKEKRSYEIVIPDVHAQYYDPSATKVHNPRWVSYPIIRQDLSFQGALLEQ